jgi:hypothetical protein
MDPQSALHSIGIPTIRGISPTLSNFQSVKNEVPLLCFQKLLCVYLHPSIPVQQTSGMTVDTPFSSTMVPLEEQTSLLSALK